MGSAASSTARWQGCVGQMWGSFCDLAMAGGPPHKGTLLEPASRAAVTAHATRYGKVLHEIRRGIMLVPASRCVSRRRRAGFGHVLQSAMAGWLLRAIVMKNIAARATSRALDLPLGPDYRLEKEIERHTSSPGRATTGPTYPMRAAARDRRSPAAHGGGVPAHRSWRRLSAGVQTGRIGRLAARSNAKPASERLAPSTLAGSEWSARASRPRSG